MARNVEVKITDNALKRGVLRELSFEKDLSGANSLKQELEILRQEHIKISKDVLQEELKKGFDKNYTRTVDNIVGKLEKDVNYLGKIQYDSRLDVGPALLETFNTILSKSPVVTGIYKFAHIVTFREKVVATSSQELMLWVNTVLPKINIKNRDVIRFINVAPYARSLERKGVTAGRTRPSFGKRKDSKGAKYITWRPSGVYALTHKKIRSKYSKGLQGGSIRFGFLPHNYLGIGTTSTMAGTQPGSGSPWRTSFKKDGRPYLYPVISFNLTSKGVL